MPPHILTNFEVQTYYQKESKVNLLSLGDNFFPQKSKFKTFLKDL